MYQKIMRLISADISAQTLYSLILIQEDIKERTGRKVRLNLPYKFQQKKLRGNLQKAGKIYGDILHQNPHDEGASYILFLLALIIGEDYK